MDLRQVCSFSQHRKNRNRRMDPMCTWHRGSEPTGGLAAGMRGYRGGTVWIKEDTNTTPHLQTQTTFRWSRSFSLEDTSKAPD